MKTKKKKAPAKKKTTASSKSSKCTAIKNKLSKSQILENIATSTGLSRKQVAAVIDEMGCLMGRSIMKNAAGEFIVPGSFKVVTINKPARKARKGINPFTGEPTIFKAKPASVAVKIRPLKGLKEYANS
jgi:nucleoid DNA-binding protein